MTNLRINDAHVHTKGKYDSKTISAESSITKFQEDGKICDKSRVMSLQLEQNTTILYIRIIGLDQICDRLDIEAFVSAVNQVHRFVLNSAFVHGIDFVEPRRDSFVCVTHLNRPAYDEKAAGKTNSEKAITFVNHVYQGLKSSATFRQEGVRFDLDIGIASGTALLSGSYEKDGVWSPRSVIALEGDAAHTAEFTAGPWPRQV